MLNAYKSEREYVEALEKAETPQAFIEAVYAITEAVRDPRSPHSNSWVWMTIHIGNNTFRFMPPGTPLPDWYTAKAEGCVMSEPIKGLIDPDAIFRQLYEAMPKFGWYVSESAVVIAQSAEEFAARGNFAYEKPLPNCIGSLKGIRVYKDEALQGRTIELRSGSDVLSTITLE